MKFTDHEKLIASLLPKSPTLLHLQRALMIEGVELLAHRGVLGIMEAGHRRIASAAEKKLVLQLATPRSHVLGAFPVEVSAAQRVAWMHFCLARDDFGDFLLPNALALLAASIPLNGIETLSAFYHSRAGLDGLAYSPELPAKQLLRHVAQEEIAAGNVIEAFLIPPAWQRDSGEVAT